MTRYGSRSVPNDRPEVRDRAATELVTLCGNRGLGIGPRFWPVPKVQNDKFRDTPKASTRKSMNTRARSGSCRPNACRTKTRRRAHRYLRQHDIQSSGGKLVLDRDAHEGVMPTPFATASISDCASSLSKGPLGMTRVMSATVIANIRHNREFLQSIGRPTLLATVRVMPISAMVGLKHEGYHEERQ